MCRRLTPALRLLLWCGVAAAVVYVATDVYAATALNLGQATRGLGLTERAAQYTCQVWQIALASLLLRTKCHRTMTEAAIL